jgi:putative two-component system response regulator
VDDDAQVRRVLERILAGVGYSCFAAPDASGALRLLNQASAELVICDVNLADTSGMELARVVLAEYPDTAVVMISGTDDPRVAHVALEDGASGYILKPFTANQVRISVDNALRRRSLEIENRSIREGLELTVESRTHELRFARRQTIKLLGRALQCRDEETADHIERMSRYCALVAERFQLDPEAVRLASAMHDVGKIGIPDRILRKPGPLTPEERTQMQEHAALGHQILTQSGSHLLDLAATVAWTHHERWDGNGYPRGLAGEAIPLEGRIAAVADVFDALTSDRVYRESMPISKAIQIMRADRGTYFDPAVLDVFLEALDDVLSIKQEFSELVR